MRTPLTNHHIETSKPSTQRTRIATTIAGVNNAEAQATYEQRTHCSSEADRRGDAITSGGERLPVNAALEGGSGLVDRCFVVLFADQH
jgi:hypothetical protein